MPLYAVVGIYWVGSPCLGLHRFSGLGFGDVRVEEWDDAIFSCRAGGGGEKDPEAFGILA